MGQFWLALLTIQNVKIKKKTKQKEERKKRKDGTVNKVRVSVKASPAEGRRRLHTTRLMPAFRVSTGLHVEHRRPSAGDAPHEGLLKVERRGFRVQVFRSLGFRV